MATALAQAHILAQANLRSIAANLITRAWTELPHYDRANLDQWLSTAVPVSLAAQRQSSSLTNAYLARAMKRQPFPITPPIGALARNGTPPEKVYERSFVTVWSALGAGVLWQDAVQKGLERATSTVAMDVQMTMRDTAQLIGEADNQIQRFQRVADGGACDFCLAVDGAILNSDSVLPLHNHCGCSVEPLTEELPVTSPPSDVAVQDHGELGPLLTGPGDHFAGPSVVH